jgi:sodium/potassium-transporting ATPase subunit alpha
MLTCAFVLLVSSFSVNDSPALKKADIGVAMGLNGSDVARDAAAVILMDDNFASIVVGVREGRTIFDNLTKTIAYTLTHMMPEVMTVLMTIAFGFPPGLSSIMILTIDLFTETPPAVSVAYEPSEADVMSKPPRNAKTDRLVTKQVIMYALLQAGAIETCACFLAFFLVFRYYGMSSGSLYMTPYFSGVDKVPMPVFPGCQNLSTTSGPFSIGGVCFDADEQNLILYEAQTAYYAMLTTAQVFHIWFCKTRNQSIFEHGLFRNEFTLWAVALEICIIILIIFAPSSNSIFFTRPFPPRFWALIVIAPAALFIWQEGRKWWVKNHPRGFIARNIHW